MRNGNYDLVVSSVLFQTPVPEVERMIAQVVAIPLRTLLILVDNDPEAAAGERSDGDVLRIATGANLGYGRAQNVAFSRGRGQAPLHLVANTDIVFAGGDIATLCRFMHENADVGLAAPRVRYPDGRLQHLCRLLPAPADLIGRRFFGRTQWGRRRDDRYELKAWAYDRPADIPFLSGCFMLLRRDVLDQVGGFDPRFFLYWEDLDLSRRINATSRTCFVPAVEIVHQYRSQSQPGFRTVRHLMLNAARYFNKWGWMRDIDRDRVNARTLAALGLTTRGTVASDSRFG